MRVLFFLLLLTGPALSADFKFTVDDDVALAITWAREQDNACACRAKNSQIASDADYVQIEVGAWAKALLQRKLDAEVQAAADAARAKQAEMRAKIGQ